MIQANLDYTQAETLRVDGQGNALIVWEQCGANTSEEALWARQYNRVLGWDEPVKIFDGEFMWGWTEMDMAPNGRAVATWATYSAVDSTLQLHARMFDPISGWGPTMDIVDSPTGFGYIEIAVGSNGNAICTWGVGILIASTYDVESGWSLPVVIDASGGSDVAAAVDELGNVLVMWIGGDYSTVKAIKYVSEEGWGEVVAVGYATYSYQVTMDIDASGNVMAVWGSNDGTRRSIQSSKYSPDMGWDDPVIIGPAEDGLFPTSLDVSAARPGEYQVIWEQSNTEQMHSAWARRWTESAGWEDPVRLSADSHSHYYMWTSISANRAGQAVAVWTLGGDSSLLDVEVSRYVPGVGWTTPAIIDNSNTLNAWFGKAEIDPLGNIVATWKLDLGQCWLWGAVYKAYWAPDVMISEPLDGTVTTEPIVTVRGYAETYAGLTVNDVPVEVQADGSFEAQVALSSGDNAVVARATDEVGNFTETSITIKFVGGSSGDPVAIMEVVSMTNWHIWRFDGRGSTDDGKIVEYLWDFGDGVTSESKVSSHRYEKAGNYIVTLTVWDDEGNTGRVSTEILVKPGGMQILI